MLHQEKKKTSAFVTRVHRSSHLGKFVVPQRGRDIFTTVKGGGDADFFFAGQPRPSPLSVGKQQRPCHLRSPAYKAYALLRIVAQDFLDLRMIGKFRVNSYDWEKISESIRKSI